MICGRESNGHRCEIENELGHSPLHHCDCGCVWITKAWAPCELTQ